VTNDIGVPGAQGFGVGVYPGALPAGFATLPGTSDPASPNYGNYLYDDGSVMVWVPAFFYKIAGNGGVDVQPESAFASVAAATLAGYALHRAFYDGGSVKRGFFVDKHKCSKTARGTGYVASSVANGLPLSAHADHNPVADITAAGANNYAATLDAPKGRGDANGAYDAASPFFCCSRFIRGALALLSLAHGQAATSTTHCAWYDAGGAKNFPKGCNNNALGDANDAEVSYVSDGYSNCGKTGSGTPAGKVAHNGQACGVVDLNGLVWEVSTGITCVAEAQAIEGITQANPAVATITGHGWSTGDIVEIYSVVGMTEVNSRLYTITAVDANTFSLDGCDSTAFTAYASGGTARKGSWYAAALATAMKDFTSGNTTATDHWGAAGVAAMMEAIHPAFETAYSAGNGYTQKFGDGAGQVLSAAVSGEGWALTGLGLPQDAGGLSTAGTNLFGQDYYYQRATDQLALLSGGSWVYSSDAGVWAALWNNARNNSDVHVGFRAACYL
jgi:hypothetical protein